MNRREALVVVGAGGFGPEVVWAARNANACNPLYDILGYCDDDADKHGTCLDGLTVLGTVESLDSELSAKPYFICAIGNNAARAEVVERVLGLGWHPASVIDPSVMVADGVIVGNGTYVGAGTIISPNAVIGEHVLINHHCSVGHDSELSAFVQLSPGARVSGACVLEEGVMLGSNAVVAPGRRVGRQSTIGAASFAMTNIPGHVTAIGNPARVTLRQR